jgi:hypothetical protein
MRNQQLASRGPWGRLALGVCLAGVVSVLGLAGRADAQKGQGSFLTQASERLAGMINKSNGAGYMLANNKFSIGGGWLKQGKEWVSLFTINLEEGKDYRFLAAGDNDAMDVDLQVVDPAMTVVAKDTKRDATAEVDYKPAKTLRYLVQVRVFESRNNLPSLTLATVMVKK